VHAAFSPDGKRIVTGAWSDDDARLWDATTGKLITELKGHKIHVLHTAFSPDGKTIVTSSADTTARLWDGHTGAPLAGPLRGHTAWLWGAAFNPRGNRLATASDDKTVRIWNVETGEELLVLRGHEFRVEGVSYAKDGLSILTWSQGATARLWKLDLENPTVVIQGHADPVAKAQFALGGKRVLTLAGGFGALNDQTARLWNAEGGEQVAVLGGEKRSGLLNSLDHTSHSAEVSRDGQRILTSYSEIGRRGVAIWEAESGKRLASVALKGTDIAEVRFSPDASRFAALSGESFERRDTVLLYRTADGMLEVSLAGHTAAINSVAFSANGQLVVTAGDDRMVRVWSSTDGKLLHTLDVGSKAEVAAISPDGTRVAAGLPETPRKGRNKSEARLRDEARRQRCQRLMMDLELGSACGRPDIATYATKLSVEMRAEASARHQ
jgi:WD40 repeat protein